MIVFIVVFVFISIFLALIFVLSFRPLILTVAFSYFCKILWYIRDLFIWHLSGNLDLLCVCVCLHICICITNVPDACNGQRKLDPVELVLVGYESSCKFWELKPGPLHEQVLLTTEYLSTPSLQCCKVGASTHQHPSQSCCYFILQFMRNHISLFISLQIFLYFSFFLNIPLITQKCIGCVHIFIYLCYIIV